MSQCRSPLAIQSSIPVMSVGTLLLHFIALSLSSLSLFFFVVDFFLFVESEGRKSTARTKPNALQQQQKKNGLGMMFQFFSPSSCAPREEKV